MASSRKILPALPTPERPAPRLVPAAGVVVEPLPGAPAAFGKAFSGVCLFWPDETSFFWAQGKELARVAVATGESTALPRGRKDAPEKLALSPDAGRLAVLDRSGSLRIVDVHKARNLVSVDDAACRSLDWLDEERMVSLRNDGSLALLDASGGPLGSIHAHALARALAVHRPSGRVLSSGSDGVGLWQRDGSAFSLVTRALAGVDVQLVAFDDAGSRVLAATPERLSVLDAVSLDVLTEIALEAPSHACQSAAFVSPDQVVYLKCCSQPLLVLHTLGAASPVVRVDVTLQSGPAVGRTAAVTSRHMIVRWS